MKRRNFLSSLGFLAALPSINFKKVVEAKASIPKPLYYKASLPVFCVKYQEPNSDEWKEYSVQVDTHILSYGTTIKDYVEKYGKDNHVLIYDFVDHNYNPFNLEPRVIIRAALLPKNKKWILAAFPPRYEYRLKGESF